MSVSTPRVPVAPSTNTGYTVSLALLFAVTVTLVASVAVAALPDVFWFPASLTPGKLMFADPLKLTPPIFRSSELEIHSKD